MDGSIQLCSESEDSSAQEEVMASLREQVQELERELAQTKLQMVESKCTIQVRHKSLIKKHVTWNFFFFRRFLKYIFLCAVN